jgi:callose synthase
VSWYEGIAYGPETNGNKYYYGTDWLDSISALTVLPPDAYFHNHQYKLIWEDEEGYGVNGSVRWFFDDKALFKIPASALGRYGTTPARDLPSEPMYLLLNTAVSPTFSKPCTGGLCDKIWPSNFTIDWVRVYQEPGELTAPSVPIDPDA